MRGLPDAVLFHLGETGLVVQKGFVLIKWAIADLEQLHAMHPYIPLSELLSRLHWRGAFKPSRLNYAVRKINRAIRLVILHLKGGVPKHLEIEVRRPDLFRHDGMHLPNPVSELMLCDIRHGLVEWLEVS